MMKEQEETLLTKFHESRGPFYSTGGKKLQDKDSSDSMR